MSMSDAESKPVSSASRYIFSTLAMEVTRTRKTVRGHVVDNAGHDNEHEENTEDGGVDGAAGGWQRRGEDREAGFEFREARHAEFETVDNLPPSSLASLGTKRVHGGLRGGTEQATVLSQLSGLASIKTGVGQNSYQCLEKLDLGKICLEVARIIIDNPRQDQLQAKYGNNLNSKGSIFYHSYQYLEKLDLGKICLEAARIIIDSPRQDQLQAK
ncbi:hypothetical protein B0H13DRAFT_1921951 [Mycena leptocephala]|nr:hypothetical protein B0H13DRAFT_1921951 [Mycena leptocephala]